MPTVLPSVYFILDHKTFFFNVFFNIFCLYEFDILIIHFDLQQILLQLLIGTFWEAEKRAVYAFDSLGH